MKIKTPLIQWVIFFAFASMAHALPSNYSQSYVFVESDLSKRLSQLTALEIFQDNSGFIWVLTQEGLNRFDGKENIIFRSDANIPGSLSSDNLQGVVQDNEGNLWFGTSQGGLNRFIESTHSFEVIRSDSGSYKGPISDRLRSLEVGLSGKLWVGYQTGGFSIFHPSTRVFKHFTQERFPEIDGSPITAFLEDKGGIVWVGTNGNGLLRLDTVENQIEKVANVDASNITLPSEKVSVLKRDRQQGLWIGTSDAGALLIKQSGEQVQLQNVYFRTKAEPETVKGVFDIYEDQAGTIFLATDAGIARFEEATGSLIHQPVRSQTTARQRIYSLMQDSSGRYWAGGYKGVFSGFRSDFTTFNAGAGLLAENVLSVETLPNGDVLVGTTHGIHTITQTGDVVPGVETPRQFFLDSPVTSQLMDGETLWLGTFDNGLFSLDLESGAYQQFLPEGDNADSISHNQITSIFKDRFGNLWIGTYSGGLSRLKPGSRTFDTYTMSVNDPLSLSDNTVYAIYQERNGDLWIGTNNGLNRFNYDTGTFDRFMHDREIPGTLSSRVVFSIHEDAEARLWVGTQGGGLNMWEPVDRKSSRMRFEYFQSNIRLPSSTIYAIRGDAEDNVWLATSGGLTRFNYGTGEAKTFTVDDGLQSNDFNLGASHKDAAGNLYFGGTSGLNIFDPSGLTIESEPPRIALTRVTLGNEQVWFDQPYGELDMIELQPDDYMLGFAFAVLDFNAPARNQYRYQMVGLDKNWVDLGNRNTIDFSKLPMGHYVLRVQGANPEGIWSPAGIALNIFVHPPFYLTWYAFVGYLVIVLLLVLSVIYQQRRREQQQLLYQSQLEADVRARTRDLRRSNEKLQMAVDEIGRARQDAVEANQAKSDFLAALSHEIRTPMHGVLGMTDLLLHSGLNDRQQGFAQSAQKSANELLGLIDNILDFSKIEAGKLELEEVTFNLREEMENLCYLYAELAQAKGLELNLVFKADLPRQLYGDPVRLRQILQNLLSNAIKFTRRGSVTLSINEVSRRDKRVELDFLVEDTGIGMDEDAIKRVFEAFSQADSSTTRQFGGTGLGLSIAKQLVELMQGLLTVQSRPGVGTTMRVLLSLEESPIYTDQLASGLLENFNVEIVAPLPETRAMFRSQFEALDLRVRECATIEELSPVAEQRRLVLVDAACLYDSACVAQLSNINADSASLVLLITPLSGEGVPDALAGIPRTTKPARSAALVNDILAADRKEVANPEAASRLLRFENRILLVEDITANQEIARAMLESFGCSVAIAKNGEVALEMFQQDDYDLVLMDCQMPVMDGFEATKHVRLYEMQHQERRRTPVIALTAGKTEAEKERCFASGMDRILYKPYSTRELNDLLARYFDAAGELEDSEQAGQARQGQPSGMHASSDLLDEAVLNNIRNIGAPGDNSLLLSVFENFKVETAEKLEELRAGSQDQVVLGAGAHAIKSMSLNMGAKALSEYCRHCESRWKTGEIGDAPREIEVLAGHVRDALRALERVVEPDEAAL